jgi:hypothetical protein
MVSKFIIMPRCLNMGMLNISKYSEPKSPDEDFGRDCRKISSNLIIAANVITPNMMSL